MRWILARELLLFKIYVYLCLTHDMGDFPQPQQKYAGIGYNCNILSSNKNFMKMFVLILMMCKHSDINFEIKNQFCKYARNCPEIW